jgi:hypothetical protein
MSVIGSRGDNCDANKDIGFLGVIHGGAATIGAS